MNLIDLLKAKSEREYEEGKNILLKDHVIETLERAKQLKEFVETNGDTITYPLLKDEKFFIALAIALILHDFGKINYDFQKKVHDKESDDWKQLREFLKPLRDINIRHEILSSIWASILLDDSYNGWKDWFSRVRTSILLHHYNEYYIGEKDLMEITQNYFEVVRKYIKFIVNNWQGFEKFLNELLNGLYEKVTDDDFIKNAIEILRDCFKLERAKTLLEMIENREDDISEFAEFYSVDNENPNYDFLVFLGCLRRCDYSASGNVSIEKNEVVLNELYRIIELNIKEKINAPLWQEKLLESTNGKSLVLIAPTGAGKTEFAILWAKNTGKKLIYTLPLRVALNDLFKRFNNYTPNNDENVGLLHSTAFMEYVTEEKNNLQVGVEKKISAAHLLSYPLMLSTPDQVFLTSLNYYGSDKIISVYPLSSFVIDEIQTYNPEMASIIIKTLKIVEKLGGKILVMTATLPPYFEPFFFGNSAFIDEIDKKYQKTYYDHRLNLKKLDTEKIKDEVKNYTLKRHRIKVIENEILIDDNLDVNDKILDYLNKLKNSGQKTIFIVVNNVSKAIKVYEFLKNEINNRKLNEDVFLLHSRLIEKVKDESIRNIKNRLEELEKIRKSNEKRYKREKGIIVVATQIIEASIDLDFDGMITEISPIDSQIQRWGRVYRKRVSGYNGDVNIYIFTKADRRTKSIYNGDTMRKVLEETVNVFKKFEKKKDPLSYEDEREMIKLVFNKEINGKTIMADFISEICRNLDFLKYFSVEKRSEAQKIFRNIAGFQVIIPSIMKLENNEQYKELAEIVSSENKNITWEDIERKVGMDKWRIRKIFYQYSINVPNFFFQSLERKRKLNEFKGVYVLDVDEEDAKIIYEFGLDKFMKDKLNAKDEEDELEIIS